MLSFLINQLGKRGPEKMHYLLNAQLEYCCSKWLLMTQCQTGISYWVGVNECVSVRVSGNDLEDGMEDMLNKSRWATGNLDNRRLESWQTAETAQDKAGWVILHTLVINNADRKWQGVLAEVAKDHSSRWEDEFIVSLVVHRRGKPASRWKFQSIILFLMDMSGAHFALSCSMQWCQLGIALLWKSGKK